MAWPPSRERPSSITSVVDPEEKTNVADQHPEIVSQLNARLVAYAREMKPSEWMKAQPAFFEAPQRDTFRPRLRP